MPKLTLDERIELLKDARGPFLNFLRNLTPQVLLASLAWILMTKLDFGRVDLDNAIPTLGFFTFLAAFIAAFIANSTLLYEEAFTELRQWRHVQHEQLKEAGFKGFSYGKAMLVAIWRERFAELLTYLYMILFFQLVFAGVVVVSMASAANYLHLTQR